MTCLELCFLHTVFSKPPFAGDGKSFDRKKDFSLTEICLCAKIRTKIRALVVVEEPLACKWLALNVACLLPEGCCHMMAVQCHVELEFVGSV